MKKLSLFFLVSALLIACDGIKEKDLLGTWQGAALLEDNMPVDIDPRLIGFEFYPDGFYKFNSTLNYREAGTYKVRGDLLYTLDTINEASTEKAVKILKLMPDSLFIKMNAEGRERIIKLFRK